MITCGIIFGGHGFDRSIVGTDPCALPDGHDGPHVAGGYYWQTDMDCGCDDCQSMEPANWCVLYWPVEAEQPVPGLPAPPGA